MLSTKTLANGLKQTIKYGIYYQVDNHHYLRVQLDTIYNLREV